MPPSTSAPVAGSSAAWPALKNRPSLTIPWLYGPMAAGAPAVEIGVAGHGSLPCWVWPTMVVAQTNGSDAPGAAIDPSRMAARTVSAAAVASASES